MRKFFMSFMLFCVVLCAVACGSENKTDIDDLNGATGLPTADDSGKMTTESSKTTEQMTAAETEMETQHTHAYSQATCVEAPTCSCGAVNGSALGHSFVEGECSRCGKSDPNYTPVSVSKLNALTKAKSYLRYSSFSYLGLVDQLEFEQFSREDALYGADHCGANWEEQALKKAQSYLKYSAFSYSGLVDQLTFEQFTEEQAIYGVDHCGADWNEQAAKKAADYLKYTSFSRQGLIDQLEFEGFTHEQAAYGADSVGLQ